ncbi:hypothetical protein PINS_up016005 [Pythium insidiosum]|nr:hypothetical protein PINS_up016005 [Pythium insidiosum]
MKTAAALLALVAFHGASADSVVPPLCGADVFRSAVETNAALRQCGLDTAFPILPPMAPPTTQQLEAMCKNTACVDGVAKALEAVKDECVLPVSRLYLREDLLDRIAVFCKTGSVPTPAPRPQPVLPAPGPVPVRPGPAPAVPVPAPATPLCSSAAVAPLANPSNDLVQCAKDSGFTTSPLTRPTPEQLTKICASQACVTVFKAAITTATDECTVPISKAQYRSDILNVVVEACKISPGPSPTTPAPTTGPSPTTTPAPTTAVPGPTSQAPVTPTPPASKICDAAAVSALIYKNKDFGACGTTSGYSFITPLQPPSKAEMDKMCADDTCKKAFADALATKPEECVIPVGRLALRGDLLDRVTNYCQTGVLPTPGPTTAPPAPGPVPTKAPIPPPGPTPAPVSPLCSQESMAPIVKPSKDSIQCSTDSGFALMPPMRPTPEQLTKICASSACTKVFTTALAANPTECTVPVSRIQYVGDFLKVVGDACKLSPGPSPTTTPAPTTAVPGPTSQAPVTPTPPASKICDAAAVSALIYKNKDFGACGTTSGYSFITPLQPPSKAEMDKMCADDTCKKAFADALATKPEECVIPVGRLALRGDLLDRVTNYCQTGVLPTPGPTTAPPAPGPVPTKAPIPPPGPTPAPVSPLCSQESMAPIVKPSKDSIQCSTDSGFALMPPMRPTPEQLTKICASSACTKVFTTALAANPTECTVPVSRIQYVGDFLKVVGDACKLSPGPSPTTTPAPTTAVPGPTSQAPVTPTPPASKICDAAAVSALIYKNKDFGACGTTSGYSFITPLQPPSKAEMDKMCADDTCKKAFADALATKPEECVIPVGRLALRGDLLDRVTNYCQTGVLPTPGPTTAPPAPGPVPTKAPIPPPGPTPAPVSPLCSQESMAPIVKPSKDSIQCSTDSGFALMPPMRPTPEQLTKICASSACTKVFTTALAANPTECTVPVSRIQYVGDFLKVVGDACKLSPGPSPTTTPAPTTAVPGPTSQAPVTPTPPASKICDAAAVSALIYKNKDFGACGTTSGYSFITPLQPPSKAEMDKMCADDTCKKAFADALATKPEECVIPVGRLALRGDLLDRVTNYCQTGVLPTPGPTTAPPAPGPVPTKAPIPPPGPTPAPVSPLCSQESMAPIVKPSKDSIQCSTDSGFALMPPMRPTPEQLTKICASSACTKVFTTALAANPTECTVPVSRIQYVGDFLKVVGDACKLSPGPSPTTTPAPTTAVPGPTSQAPVTPTPPASKICDAAAVSALIYKNKDFGACGTTSGYSFITPLQPPSKAEMDKMCADDTCKKAFADALATKPEECVIPVGRLALRGDLLDRVTNYCQTGVLPTPGPTTAPPAPGPVPTKAPIPPPGPTPAPVSPLCSQESMAPIVKPSKDSIQCSTDSGFALMPPMRPTPEQLTKICASSACTKVFTTALAANPTECTVPVSRIQYVGDFLKVVGDACKLSPGPSPTTTPAPTTAVPGPTSQAPVTPTPVPTSTVPVTPTPTTPVPTTPVPTTPAPTTPAPTTPTPTTPTPTTPTPTTPTPTTAKPGPISGGPCGNEQKGPQPCPEGEYCQPWNPWYYQCRSIGNAKCGKQEVGIDFFGDDLETVSVRLPEECCAKCRNTEGCQAYTFINYNADGQPRCYLKKGTGHRRELVGAVSAVVAAPECAVASGGQCGSDSHGVKCCPSGEYCQPWNPWYYQCRPAPQKCGKQEVGIDYFGDDLERITDIMPWECCDRCAATAGCKAYTFVNYNADGKAICYLKKGVGQKRQLVGAVSSQVLNPKPTCSTPEWGACGNSSGSQCCPSGFYCQPWNPMYYQCMATPAKCSKQLTDVDFFGSDLATIYGISPSDCCAKCAETKGCKAYTFVNANPGRPACYLKWSASGQIRLTGAVSGILNH